MVYVQWARIAVHDLSNCDLSGAGSGQLAEVHRPTDNGKGAHTTQCAAAVSLQGIARFAIAVKVRRP
jgi:hypothetical protein